MSGVISSIITNSSAMVALNSLNTINSQLNTVQTAVSTGYRVSSAVQDGAAFAVAQSVRSNVAGLTAANQQLGGAQGLLGTATTGLTAVSNTMTDMRGTLTNLANQSVTGNERAQYITTYKNDLVSVQNALYNSNYAGRNLISGTSAGQGVKGGVNIINNEVGSSFSITGFGGSTLLNKLSFTSTQLNSAASVSSFLTASGAFTTQSNNVGSALNTLGNETNLVSNQITFNTNKIDALNNGLGSLIDTNMAQESAKLQSLQIQQQLATSALSIANQAPSLLTKLFP